MSNEKVYNDQINEKLQQFREAFQDCLDQKGAWNELQAAATAYDAAVSEESEDD